VPLRAELAKSHEDEGRANSARREWFTLIAITAVIVAVGFVLWLVGDIRGTVSDLQVEVGKIQQTQEEIQQAQAEGKVRGLKLRALACRNLERQGETFEADDPCRDAELVPWFEPSPPPTRTEGP
jgi:hypothetical protein